MAEKWLVIEKDGPICTEIIAITDDKESAERIAKMCIERTTMYKYSVDNVGYFKSVDDFIRENQWVESGPMGSIFQYVDGKLELTGHVPMSKVGHINRAIVTIRVLNNTPNVVSVGVIIPPDTDIDPSIENYAKRKINRTLKIMANNGFTEFSLRYMTHDMLESNHVFEMDISPSKNVNAIFTVVVNLDTETLEKPEDK